MQISNVSQTTFDSLRAKLLETHQADVTGSTEGEISGHGVVANYHYDSGSQTLSVDVVKHPFFIPVSAIESQLRNAVAAA